MSMAPLAEVGVGNLDPDLPATVGEDTDDLAGE